MTLSVGLECRICSVKVLISCNARKASNFYFAAVVKIIKIFN